MVKKQNWEKKKKKEEKGNKKRKRNKKPHKMTHRRVHPHRVTRGCPLASLASNESRPLYNSIPAMMSRFP